MSARTRNIAAAGGVVAVALVIILILLISSSSQKTNSAFAAKILPAVPAKTHNGYETPGSGLGANVVVQIGAASITQAELDHWLVVANASSQGTTPAPALPVPPAYTACIASERVLTPTAVTATLKTDCIKSYQNLLGEALSYLIQATWIQGEAVTRGVAVSAAQTQADFEQIRKTSSPSLVSAAALNSFMAKSGETLTDLKWRTYVGLLTTDIQKKVQNSASHVTSAQITAYYNKNRAQFAHPQTRNLHVVETTTLANANTVKALLASGSSYSVVAAKYSIDPTSKAAGGAINGVASGTTLTPQLNTAVFAAPVGVLSGPVKTTAGYYVFTVDKVIAPTTETLAQAQTAVKTAVVEQQVNAAETALQSGFIKKWSARTNCRASVLAADTSTGATSATPSPLRGLCAKSAISTVAVASTSRIQPPPSAAQTLVYTPPKTTATATTPTAPAVTTPTTGPLATEPVITVPPGPDVAVVTKLVKKDLIVGNGTEVAAGDTVSVNYVGALYSNGKIFDSSWSRKQVFTTAIGTGAVIKGWDQGIVGMRVGGRRELIIPPALGYGKVAQGAIPANSTLVFIVDLLAVTPPSGG